MKVGDMVQHRWYGSGQGTRKLFISIITRAWRWDQHNNRENLYSVAWVDDRPKPARVIPEGELKLVSSG